jgi:outer membrane receptor for ferrienterochelin and colicins
MNVRLVNSFSRKALASLVVCGSLEVVLAEPATRDVNELTLDELLEVKIRTVTAAEKREQTVSEAPSAVTIITSDEIQKLGYRNLGEILAATRGFYTSSDRNYTYLGVRGFSRPGDYNSRVLVMVNGQRMNDNVTGGALLGSETFIDAELIDHVEIVRGPGSALYGSSAFFGVVNVVTKTGKDIQGAEASFTSGSFDSYKGQIRVGWEFKNEVDLLLAGTLMDSAGHEHLFYREYQQPPVSDGIARNVDSESIRSIFSRLSWKGLTLDGGWRERTKQLPTGSFDAVFNDPRNQTIDGEFFGRLAFEHSFENDLTLSASTAYNGTYYDGSYIYPDVQGTSLIGAGVPTYRLRDGLRGRRWTENASVRKLFWERLSVSVGFEARQNLKQDQFTYREPSLLYVLDSHRGSQAWGPYTDASYTIVTNLTVAAGVRYDRGDFPGSALSPRSSLVYSPVPGTTGKLLYGKSFRAPNSYERFYTDGETQKGNPNLRPEEIETYEVVVEQELGSHFRATAAAYTYYIDDLINQVTDPADSLLVYQNLNHVRGRGLETELQGHFSHGFRGKIAYSIQNAIDRESHARLSNSPRNMIQGNLIIPLYKEEFFGGIEVRYLSNRTGDTGEKAPPYWITNLTLFSHRWVNGLELSVSIYNLFDRHYSDPTPLELRQNILEQDGRTYQARLTYHF